MPSLHILAFGQVVGKGLKTLIPDADAETGAVSVDQTCLLCPTNANCNNDCKITSCKNGYEMDRNSTPPQCKQKKCGPHAQLIPTNKPVITPMCKCKYGDNRDPFIAGTFTCPGPFPDTSENDLLNKAEECKKSGLVLNKSTGKCVIAQSISSLPANCIQDNVHGRCTKCKTGYDLRGGKCLPIQDGDMGPEPEFTGQAKPAEADIPSGNPPPITLDPDLQPDPDPEPDPEPEPDPQPDPDPASQPDVTTDVGHANDLVSTTQPAPLPQREVASEPDDPAESDDCKAWKRWGKCADDDGEVTEDICGRGRRRGAEIKQCIKTRPGSRGIPLQINKNAESGRDGVSKDKCEEALAYLKTAMEERKKLEEKYDKLAKEIEGIDRKMAELMDTEGEYCDDCMERRLTKLKEIIDPAPKWYETLGNVLGTVGAAALGYYGVKEANKLRDMQGFSAQPQYALGLAYPFIMKGLYGGGLFGKTNSLACSPTAWGNGGMFGNPFLQQQMMNAQRQHYMQQMLFATNV